MLWAGALSAIIIGFGIYLFLCAFTSLGLTGFLISLGVALGLIPVFCLWYFLTDWIAGKFGK